ncbi:hypothetical protein DFJ74DRAFT_628619 [Hyaloraphidium curvatum]|nr:hypothetical protein DFJ74DRAFT_628619 [Hyaloraphidium curvatum]
MRSAGARSFARLARPPGPQRGPARTLGTGAARAPSVAGVPPGSVPSRPASSAAAVPRDVPPRDVPAWPGVGQGAAAQGHTSGAGWGDAVARAEAVVHPAGGSVIDPARLLGADLAVIAAQIRRLLGSGHPVLNTVSAYYFNAQGKHVRPLIVLLMSMATSVAPKARRAQPLDEDAIDRPLAPGRVRYPPPAPDAPDASPLLLADAAADPARPHILPAQKRLAEITEMIHTASLLHDDVIDESPTRRAQPSANAAFGNKMAVLAGDFLLARASVALARLRDVEVVELLATVISNLVEGEFMQLRNSQAADAEGRAMDRFEYYLEKTYLKTASLIAKSCRAAAVLGGCTAEVVEQAYEYGRSAGLAFQIVDDMLDFVSTSEALGKPKGADLNLGLATAPVLYAAEEFPQLNELIERKFSHEGDVDTAFELVHRSRGIERTRALAEEHCRRAVDAVRILPPSEAREAMIQLTNTILTRRK